MTGHNASHHEHTMKLSDDKNLGKKIHHFERLWGDGVV